MHPGVLEVAAVAQPDERAGEVVALFVVKQDPSLTGYKVPKRVHFLDGIALDDGLMQEDGLHPNASAQPKLVAQVWPVLLPLLAR